MKKQKNIESPEDGTCQLNNAQELQTLAYVFNL